MPLRGSSYGVRLRLIRWHSRTPRVHAIPERRISSEDESKPKLHHARAAHLETWSESAVRRAGTEHQIQERRRLPEQRARQETDWIGVVCLIEQIEGLKSCLQRRIVRQVEPPSQREVELRMAPTADRIASEISLAVCRRDECRWIQAATVEPYPLAGY